MANLRALNTFELDVRVPHGVSRDDANTVLGGWVGITDELKGVQIGRAITRRVIADTPRNRGVSLLDLIERWTETDEFRRAGFTYDQLLLQVIALIEPSLVTAANYFSYVHPVLQRERFIAKFQ